MCFTWLRSKLVGAAPAMALRTLEGRYAARAAPAAAPAPPFRSWRRENGVDRKLGAGVMGVLFLRVRMNGWLDGRAGRSVVRVPGRRGRHRATGGGGRDGEAADDAHL